MVKRNEPQSRQRNNMIAFRTNDKEDGLIRNMASYLGVSVASFCRAAVLNEAESFERLVGDVEDGH